MKKKSYIQSSLYLKVFFLFVGLIVLISVSYKLFLLFKNRSFTSYSYTVLVTGKNSYVININTKEKTISMLVLDKVVRYNNLLSASIEIGVPIQGSIISKKNDEVSVKQFFSFKNISQAVIDRNTFSLRGLNELDILKLYFASKGVKDTDIKVINFKAAETEQIDQAFRDSKIFNEKVSIEIINGTELDGFGGKFAKMLEAVGYNVISISTAKERILHSKVIYRTAQNNTVKSLRAILPFMFEFKEESAIADVTIILGKDLNL